jgi:signal transduction histidine kinase
MRVPRPLSLRVALVVIGATAVGLGAGGAPMVVASGRFEHPALTVALGLLVGWSFVGVGLFGWWRRPDNRVGALMTAVGFAWFAGGLWLAPSALWHTVGVPLNGLYYAVLAHMLLAFPSGRLGGRGERRVVAAIYLVALAGQLAAMPFLDTARMFECACPRNLLLVHRDDRLVGVLLGATETLGVALTLTVALLLVRRWRAASPRARRALAPVLGAGAAVTGLSAAHLAANVGGVPRPLGTGTLLLAVLAMVSVPYAFLAGLARTRFFQVGAVGGLVARLAAGPGAGRLRDALAAALGDDTVEVAYWLPERGRYGDQDGRAVDLPDAGQSEALGRAVARIERDGRPVGAIVYDVGLADEPELVRAVAGAAALALENERLQAELRARVAELERSRAQVVEAAEAERRRLERDLHDGAQQRLVALRLKLGLARDGLRDRSDDRGGDGNPADPATVVGAAGAADAALASAVGLLDAARADLDSALAELRELARGLHPAVLTNRGLGAAVRSLVARCPVPVRVVELPPARLPGPVESAAYFVVAEGLTNVAKHARAAAATVRLAQHAGHLLVEVGDDGAGGADPAGSGLRGLAARVAALDGRLRVTAGGGGMGTLVHAEIPIPGAEGASRR